MIELLFSEANWPMLCGACSTLFLMFFFMSAMCGIKGNPRWFLVVAIYGIVIQKICMSVIWMNDYGEEIWFRWLYFFSYIVNVFIFIWSFYRFLKGGILKIWCTFILGEIILSMIIWIGNILVMIAFWSFHISKYYVLKYFLGNLMGIILYFALYHILLPLFKKYQNYNFRYPLISGALCAVYMIAGLWSFIVELFFLGVNNWVLQMSPFVIIGAGIVLILMVHSVLYEREMQKKYKYLMENRQEMSLWYDTLKMQEQEISKDYLEKSLVEFLEADSGKINQRQMKEYIDSLKSKYDAVEAGVYCADCSVDALLVTLREICREKEIEAEINFQKFDPGEIDTDEFNCFLNALLKPVIKCMEESSDDGEKKTLKLGSAAIKNQLILELCTTGIPGIHIKKREYQRFIAKYDGILKINSERNDIQILVSLQRK